MGLLEEARADTARTSHNTCDVERCSTSHADVFDEIVAVIADRRISIAAATRTFAAHDIPIARHTIERHRHGECRTCSAAGRVFTGGDG